MTTDAIHPIAASTLVREIAEILERPAADVKPVLEALEVCIASHLRGGHHVRLMRLGTLTVKATPERWGKSFGQETVFRARKRVSFKPGKQLRDVLEAAD